MSGRYPCVTCLGTGQVEVEYDDAEYDENGFLLPGQTYMDTCDDCDGVGTYDTAEDPADVQARAARIPGPTSAYRPGGLLDPNPATRGRRTP